jgi:hypothetical protein
MGLASAPAARGNAQVAAADTVRLRPLAGPRIRGVVTARLDDALTVRPDSGVEIRVRLDSLRSAEVLRGRKRLGWRAVRWGAGIGAVAGLIAAPMLKASDDRANAANAGQTIDVLPSSLAFYEFASATLGAVVGSVVGAAVSPLRVERWEPIGATAGTAGPRHP